MENVKELIKDIKTNLSQVSSSQKDEVRIMRAMLNDKDFEVDIYEKEGKVGTYCPAKDVRNMISNVISSTAKITNEEASMFAEIPEEEYMEKELSNHQHSYVCCDDMTLFSYLSQIPLQRIS